MNLSFFCCITGTEVICMNNMNILVGGEIKTLDKNLI